MICESEYIMSMNPVDTSLGMVRFSLKGLMGGLVVLAAASLCGGNAIAQERTAPASSNSQTLSPTLNDQFERTYFTFDKTFYQNRRFPRSATWIFGPYVENQIAGDGRVTHRLYRDAMRQQSESDPTIRTADLPTPYSSSLMSGSLYTVEPVPPATVSPTFRQSGAAPTSVDGGVRETPVPALW
jgi:hypothetical protein